MSLSRKKKMTEAVKEVLSDVLGEGGWRVARGPEGRDELLGPDSFVLSQEQEGGGRKVVVVHRTGAFEWEEGEAGGAEQEDEAEIELRVRLLPLMWPVKRAVRELTRRAAVVLKDKEVVVTWRGKEDVDGNVGQVYLNPVAAVQLYARRPCWDAEGRAVNPVDRWLELLGPTHFERGVVCNPGVPHNGTVFNLWEGLGVQAKEGPLMVGGETTIPTPLMAWLARLVQRPMSVQTVLVLDPSCPRSKSMGELARALMGRHGKRLVAPDWRHGEYLWEDAALFHCPTPEIEVSQTVKRARRQGVAVVVSGGASFQVQPNDTQVLALGPLPFDPAQVDPGHLLWHLERFPASGHADVVCHTEELLQLKLASSDPWVRRWYDVLCEGTNSVGGGGAPKTWNRHLVSDEITVLTGSHMGEETLVRLRQATQQQQQQQHQPRVWRVPPLDEARRLFLLCFDHHPPTPHPWTPPPPPPSPPLPSPPAKRRRKQQ